jgi:two-component system phosphate regulon sensor histidine kinase PhoR
MLDKAIDVRLIIDSLDEPTIIVSGSRIELANAPARKLLGEQIEGRDVRLAIRHPQALDLILAHRSGEIDVTGIGEVGRAWRLVIKTIGTSVMVRMADRSAAVSTEKIRVDFVANASHELRTPLATIIGYSETLAEDSELTDELRSSFSQTIGDEAHRMLRIIEDLMNLSRVEANRFVKPTELIRIRDVIDEVVTNTQFATDARQCRVTTHFDDDLPELPGDFDQLVQVFDNLLTNAVRYGCAANGCTISISVTHEAGFAAIAVADQGRGITKEHLPRLTERFYRVDAARSRESGGTGLGLAIVKHVVERHRGSLEIVSEPGIGTTITVRIPTAV